MSSWILDEAEALALKEIRTDWLAAYIRKTIAEIVKGTLRCPETLFIGEEFARTEGLEWADGAYFWSVKVRVVDLSCDVEDSTGGDVDGRGDRGGPCGAPAVTIMGDAPICADHAESFVAESRAKFRDVVEKALRDSKEPKP